MLQALPIVVRTVDEKKTAFSNVHFSNSSASTSFCKSIPPARASRSITSYWCSFGSINVIERFWEFITVARKLRLPVTRFALRLVSLCLSAGYSNLLNIWNNRITGYLFATSDWRKTKNSFAVSSFRSLQIFTRVETVAFKQPPWFIIIANLFETEYVQKDCWFYNCDLLIYRCVLQGFI